MNDGDPQNEFPASQKKLHAALSRLDARRIAVPPETDDAILRAVREQLRPMKKPAEEISRWDAWRAGLTEFFSLRRLALAGAGAAVVMGVVGALLWPGGRTPLMANREDVNGDGVVDMLDAFALARELEAGAASHPQLDLNGDGVVDGRDVQILAARAVSLEQGGRS